MKIQWLDDSEENMYSDLMIKKQRPKKYPRFDVHEVCRILGECTCGKGIEMTKRIADARKRKYMVECE